MTESIRMITKLEYWVLILMLTFSMFIIFLPLMSAFYILGDIGGGTATASWGVSFFLVGNAITKPVGRVLSEKYGNYRVLKGSIALTLLVFFPLLFTQDYNVYLVFRYLGGLFSGPIFSTITNICRIHRPDDEINFLMLLVISILLSAGIASSIFGAVLSYVGLWRASYIIIYSMGLILFILLCILTKGHESPITEDAIDWVGIISFWIAFTGLGFCLITGLLIDGFRSLAFNIILTLSCSILLFFFIWNSMHRFPLLPFKHFRKKKFAIAIIHLTVVYTAYTASSLLLNYWLVLYANYTVKWLGYLLAADLIGPLVAIFVFPYRTSKLNIWMTTAAIGMLCCLTYASGNLSVQVDLFRIAIIKIGIGVALALHLPMVLYNIRTSFTAKEFGEGWAFFVIFKLIGSLFGMAYFAILWEKRAAFYYWRLGGELTLFSQNTLQVLKNLTYFRFTPLMKESGLNIALDRQARALAINDCFFFITCILFGIFVLSLLYSFLQKYFKDETLLDPIMY